MLYVIFVCLYTGKNHWETQSGFPGVSKLGERQRKDAKTEKRKVSSYSYEYIQFVSEGETIVEDKTIRP